MKILFTGGYTLGSVTPLLAVVEEVRRSTIHDPRSTIIWVGTRKGPERKLVSEARIRFYWLWVPKWRRYFDWRNFFVPVGLGFSVLWAIILLMIHRPGVIVTAGGFVGVPLVWAGRILGIPSLLHNQDARWSLANRLVAPFVKRITYALPNTLPRRWENKAVLTGNPIREFVLNGNKEKALKMCGFSRMPTILVIGGGTGAQRLNEIVREALPELTKDYQVVHLTGKNKNVFPSHDLRSPSPFGRGEGEGQYCPIEFVTHEIADLYAAADLVITRAGMGVLTELSALGKCMIIVPIPDTHQQENAAYFKKHNAAVVLDQKTLTGNILSSAVKQLFNNIGAMQEHAERAKEFFKPNAAEQLAKEVINLAILAK